MTIQEFVAKYPVPSRPIEAVVRRWVAEREVRDFLGAPIIAGVTVADLMTGDRLVDTLAPDVKEAFRHLTGPAADTREEIERLILEKIELGDASVLGLINKIQGQLGEDTFVRLVGSAAQLAASKSQEGWDVRVGDSEPFTYVQVKVYEDPTGLSDHLEVLKEKLARGEILDGQEVLSRLDVAVPSDIHAAVKESALELGYPGEVLDLHVTRDELRAQLLDSVENVQEGFGHFFEELLGDVAAPGIIHAVTNAFLLYKGAKDRRAAVEDTLYSSAISAGGIIAASTVDQILGYTLLVLDLQDAAAIVSSPAGGFLLLGISMSTRALLRRLADRRFVVRHLTVANDNLHALITRAEAYTLVSL